MGDQDDIPVQGSRRTWQEVAERLLHTVDGLGTPIDEKILETVVALNVLGVCTSQSCEGHLDHGRPYPWITFTTALAETLKQSANVVAETDYAAAHHLKRQVEALHAHDQQKVLGYLALFYAQRQVPYDQLLIVYSRIPGTSRLECQGGITQVLQPAERQAQKLVAYQQEMQAFAAFLKACYEDQTEQTR